MARFRVEGVSLVAERTTTTIRDWFSVVEVPVVVPRTTVFSGINNCNDGGSQQRSGAAQHSAIVCLLGRQKSIEGFVEAFVPSSTK